MAVKPRQSHPSSLQFCVLLCLLLVLSRASCESVEGKEQGVAKSKAEGQIPVFPLSGRSGSGNVVKAESSESRGYSGSEEHDSAPVHYATYTTHGGGFNPLTIIAITVFGLLALILTLQLLGVQSTSSLRDSNNLDSWELKCLARIKEFVPKTADHLRSFKRPCP